MNEFGALADAGSDSAGRKAARTVVPAARRAARLSRRWARYGDLPRPFVGRTHAVSLVAAIDPLSVARSSCQRALAVPAPPGATRVLRGRRSTGLGEVVPARKMLTRTKTGCRGRARVVAADVLVPRPIHLQTAVRIGLLDHNQRMDRSVFAADVLEGQVALVTGGATGIGKEICRVLGAHGARVTLASRKKENLEATVEELKAEGVDAAFGVCDVRDADAVRAVVELRRDRPGTARHRDQRRRRQFPCAHVEDLTQRLQSRSRHRSARHVQRDSLRVRRLAGGSRWEHRQHQCSVSAEGSGVPVARCGGKGRGRFAHSNLCRRVGALRDPSERDRTGINRQERREFGDLPKPSPTATIAPKTLWACRATGPTSRTWLCFFAARWHASSPAR